jgi:hypothetical protein
VEGEVNRLDAILAMLAAGPEAQRVPGFRSPFVRGPIYGNGLRPGAVRTVLDLLTNPNAPAFRTPPGLEALKRHPRYAAVCEGLAAGHLAGKADVALAERIVRARNVLAFSAQLLAREAAALWWADVQKARLRLSLEGKLHDDTSAAVALAENARLLEHLEGQGHVPPSAAKLILKGGARVR